MVVELTQQGLIAGYNNVIVIDESKPYNDFPSYLKPDKIKEHLKEWNTIPDVELYKDLYNVCSQLFLLTYHHRLKNVSYYTDTEIDNGKKIKVMYAEINNTWQLELKDRYNLHKNLVERVKSNDLTLNFCDNNNDNSACYVDSDSDSDSDFDFIEDEGQLSLFF